MMKNKKMMIVLIPLVVVIWGLVLYRILDFQSDEVATLPPPSKAVIDTNTAKNEVFHIVADYRDPFLGRVAKKTKPKPKDAIARKKVIKKPPIPVKWPPIVFGGVIRNQQSKQEVAILTVNQQEALLAVDDKLQGVTLKKIFNNDSILVAMNQHKKTIRKQ